MMKIKLFQRLVLRWANNDKNLDTNLLIIISFTEIL